MRGGTLKVFFSYAHEDEQIVANLQKHLAPLRHERVLEFWYDRKILAGQAWAEEISDHLEQAELFVFLVSSDFLSSEYAYGRELRRALELHAQNKLLVAPVIARNCVWQKLPLASLQVLPREGRPITDWPNHDDAYVSAALGIEDAARKLLTANTSLVSEWLTSRLIRRKVIRFAQQHLARLGLYDGPVDGIPGPKTERAVVRFQRERGLKVDAMIGPEVIQRLEEDMGATRNATADPS